MPVSASAGSTCNERLVRARTVVRFGSVHVHKATSRCLQSSQLTELYATPIPIPIPLHLANKVLLPIPHLTSPHIVHSTFSRRSFVLKDRRGQHRTAQNSTGQLRTAQDSTGQHRSTCFGSTSTCSYSYNSLYHGRCGEAQQQQRSRKQGPAGCCCHTKISHSDTRQWHRSLREGDWSKVRCTSSDMATVPAHSD